MKAIYFSKKNFINDLEIVSRLLSCSGDMFISAYEINEVIISRLRNLILKNGTGFESNGICEIVSGRMDINEDAKLVLRSIVGRIGLEDYRYYSGSILYPVMAPPEFCFKKLIMSNYERAREIYRYKLVNNISFYSGEYGMMRLELARFVIDRLVSLRGIFN